MHESASTFTHSADFDPQGDFKAFLRSVPARWGVYLFADADDQPVQLLCVKNLRASLKRRLGGEETIGLSKRVNYRELVRRVHWRRVDSAFEADWIYYEAARAVFRQTYRGMVGFRPAWFIHVNPETRFPRYVKTIDLSKGGLLLGPVEDKHVAARLIQHLEDAFDLCRYYSILVEAPDARACAYKQMHKCPAPCDGSISIDQYRGMIQWSAETLIDPAPMVRDQEQRMRDAAAELRFESAAKIKSFSDKIGQLGRGPFRHVRRLSDFTFLTIQHGPREQTAKAFLITSGRIEEVLGLIAIRDSIDVPGLLRCVLSRLADQIDAPVDEIGAERIGIVAQHLFAAKSRHGVFLPIGDIDERSAAKAWRDLRKQTREPEQEGEGVVKELQSIQS